MTTCRSGTWTWALRSFKPWSLTLSCPMLELYFKYSDAIVVVYVTMMYGLGMPILFPIAAFTLFNQWLCERIVVAWSVKLPPAMDDTLSKNALALLKYSPLFLLFNGYWMISNR